MNPDHRVQQMTADSLPGDEDGTMMSRIRLLLYVQLFLLSLHISPDVSAQPVTDPVDQLQELMRQFDYPGVIERSRQLLQNGDEFSQAELVEIHRLRGIAHYHLNALPEALNSFHQLLSVDPGYLMDPDINPPKVIEFFESVRTNRKALIAEHEAHEKSATHEIAKQQSGTFARSLILPGSGQLKWGYRLKGWTLAGSAAVTLAGAVYFSIDAAAREDDYLNASDPAEIESRYQAYNRSYKWRNAMYGLFAGIWLYTQFDLLFISTGSPVNISTHFTPDRSYLSIRFQF